MKTRRKHEALFELVTDGECDDQGNLIVIMKMYNRADFVKFYSQFEPGRRFAATFRVLDTGDKAWIRAYYFAEVVNAFIEEWEDRGDFLDKNEAHAKMKKLFPKMRIIDEAAETPGKRKEVKTISIMDESFGPPEFWEYIEFLKQYAAEHFGRYIKDVGERTQ